MKEAWTLEVILAINLKSHMKYSFRVFDHALKTFERDKRLGVASTFNARSCFHIMIKHWSLWFIENIEKKTWGLQESGGGGGEGDGESV